METSMPNGVFQDIIKNFEDLTKNADIFLQQNHSVSGNFKNISKSLYDHIIRSNPLTALKSKSLPTLLVEGFDDEQIWQQLELQNKSAVTHFGTNLSKLDTTNLILSIDTDDDEPAHRRGTDVSKNNEDLNHLSISNEDEAMDETQDKFESSDDEDYDLNDCFGDDVEDSEKSPAKVSAPKSKKVHFDLHDDIETTKRKTEKSAKQSKYQSKVDDQFFKLSKLEQFLRLEDLKEEKARDGELSDDEEGEIDLFQDIPSDVSADSEDEDDFEMKKSSKDIMYEDFFDAPETEDKGESEMSDLEKEDTDFVDNDEDAAEDDESDEEIESQTSFKDGKEVSKTPFELKQEEINKKISEYEKTLVTPKPWQLTGEVDASSRPTDGLLDLPTEFDMNAKPGIIQDKEFCEKIEDLIKMTKKNQAYSDGVRMVKTNEELIAAKKGIILEQTKSKKSLAQEYEDIYLKKQSKQEDEEENPKHKEITKFMDSLFPELYALFSHIPKPAVPDIKIVSNLPAITVEEVAPTSYSDAALLAPEEIKKRTGLLKGQTERTDEDRKRERRKKKLHLKMKQKKKEKENTGEKPLSAKARKKEKLETLKKLKQHKNTKIASMDGEKIKSSKDFFARLQETVTSKVSKNENKPVKKKRKT